MVKPSAHAIWHRRSNAPTTRAIMDTGTSPMLTHWCTDPSWCASTPLGAHSLSIGVSRLPLSRVRTDLPIGQTLSQRDRAHAVAAVPANFRTDRCTPAPHVDQRGQRPPLRADSTEPLANRLRPSAQLTGRNAAAFRHTESAPERSQRIGSIHVLGKRPRCHLLRRTVTSHFIS